MRRGGGNRVRIPVLRNDKMVYLGLYELNPDIILADIIDTLRRQSSGIGIFTFKDVSYYVVDNYLLREREIILYRVTDLDVDTIVIRDTSDLFLRRDNKSLASLVVHYGYALRNDSDPIEKKIFLDTSDVDLNDPKINKYLKASIALL